MKKYFTATHMLQTGIISQPRIQGSVWSVTLNNSERKRGKSSLIRNFPLIDVMVTRFSFDNYNKICKNTLNKIHPNVKRN